MSDHIPFSVGGSSKGLTSGFPTPWSSYSSEQMPTSLTEVLKWCEFLVSSQPTYRAALERVVSYFITEVEVSNTDEDGKRNYKDFFHNTLGIQNILKIIGLDVLTYGTSFLSVIAPTRRYLRCGTHDCGFEAPIAAVMNTPIYNFKWSSGTIHASCPRCKKSSEWTQVTRRSFEPERIQLKRWNPFEMEIEWYPYTDNANYIWKIPPYFKRHIARGDNIVLEDTPWEVVEAALHNQNIKFGSDEIYAIKEPTLAGHYVRGWGVSRVLTHFRQAWYLAVLHRHNEAIALDYIMPLRLLSPDTHSGGGSIIGDPMHGADLGSFNAKLQGALQAHRNNPTGWMMSPYPVKYQFIGSGGDALVPHEMINQGKTDLLDAIGVPVELYKANLSVQTGPVAIRIMEANWAHLLFTFNRTLQWIADKLSVIMSWDPAKVHLVKPSLADDIDRQLARLQLMLSGEISRTTGYKTVGLDFKDETQKKFEDEQLIAEETERAQEIIERQGMGKQMAMGEMGGMPGGMQGGMPMGGGGMPAGGMPMGGGGMPQGGGAPAGAPPVPGMPPNPVDAILAQVPMVGGGTLTPMDLEASAGPIAQSIFMLPPGQRISALRRLKQMQPALHSLVKSYLEQMDNQARQQGKETAQMAAQQTGQGMVQPPIM